MAVQKSPKSGSKTRVVFHNISRTVCKEIANFEYVIDGVRAYFRSIMMFNKSCVLRGQNRDQRCQKWPKNCMDLAELSEACHRLSRSPTLTISPKSAGVAEGADQELYTMGGGWARYSGWRVGFRLWVEGGHGTMGGSGWVRRKHGHVGCRWKGLSTDIMIIVLFIVIRPPVPRT